VTSTTQTRGSWVAAGSGGHDGGAFVSAPVVALAEGSDQDECSWPKLKNGWSAVCSASPSSAASTSGGLIYQSRAGAAADQQIAAPSYQKPKWPSAPAERAGGAAAQGADERALRQQLDDARQIAEKAEIGSASSLREQARGQPPVRRENTGSRCQAGIIRSGGDGGHAAIPLFTSRCNRRSSRSTEPTTRSCGERGAWAEEFKQEADSHRGGNLTKRRPGVFSEAMNKLEQEERKTYQEMENTSRLKTCGSKQACASRGQQNLKRPAGGDKLDQISWNGLERLEQRLDRLETGAAN